MTTCPEDRQTTERHKGVRPLLDHHRVPRGVEAADSEVKASPAESVRGKHVVIVGINYWPEPTGIAPYTTQIAEHLARSAASVTVLTGLPSYPSWRVDPAYRGHIRLRESRKGVDVVRLAHHVPSRQSAARRALYETSFLANAMSVRLPQRPDIVLAATPALSGAVAANRIAQRHGVPFVVVVQDLIAQASTQTGISGGSALTSMVARLEGRALTSADVVAVVAEAFRPHVEAYGVKPERIKLFPNWAHVPEPLRDRRAVRRQLGWSEDTTIALHTGNMGLKQDLGNVIEAARVTKDRPGLMWVLMGDGSQREALISQAGDLHNVRFLPPCLPEEYADVIAAADVLLVNERPSVGDMSLPSKLTSYFMSGQPVAAAVAPKGATASEMDRVNATARAPAGDPRAMAALVEAIAARPDWATTAGERGRNYAVNHLSVGSAMSRLDSLLSLT